MGSPLPLCCRGRRRRYRRHQTRVQCTASSRYKTAISFYSRPCSRHCSALLSPATTANNTDFLLGYEDPARPPGYLSATSAASGRLQQSPPKNSNTVANPLARTTVVIVESERRTEEEIRDSPVTAGRAEPFFRCRLTDERCREDRDSEHGMVDGLGDVAGKARSLQEWQ